MARTILVSNRLPITVADVDGALRVERSGGGLATGLAGVHARGDGSWIGWPGPTWTLDDRRRSELDARLSEMRLAPVHLTHDEHERYYESFSNGVLWPLFHYSIDRVPLHQLEWDAYRAVNERFARAVADLAGRGDVVWVHDYQLLLVPRLLRALRPDLRIGFFLHIPFPASAVFRTLPHRDEVLDGMLGADLVGFHAQSYLRHFAASVLRVLGDETHVDEIRRAGHVTRIGCFPMGVDAAEYERLAGLPSVVARAYEIRGPADGRILLGIDRLDYTKGIARRLTAFERFLETTPDAIGRVRLVQVAVPSRPGVHAYREQRERIDALVGRIQGRYGTATWTPVQYLHRSFGAEDVVAFYRAADALLVTPVRDGMNLVAKEFVAARPDEDGVLVLSEFAGAAAELDGALHVNPYDVDGMVHAFRRALEMPREERRARMRRMRTRVRTADADSWARRFLAALEDATRGAPEVEDRPVVARALGGAESGPGTTHGERGAELARGDAHSVTGLVPEDAWTEPGVPLDELRNASRRVLFLDHDGTLVPFAARPADAAPDAELLDLLEALAADTRNEVHVVSGRPRDDLEAWFGERAVHLHAEHGLWSRRVGARAWRRLNVPGLPHDERIRALLEEYAERTPGAHVEVKSSVLAWHWRAADPAFGSRQANELRLHLAEVLSNVGVEVVCGDRVVELRPYGLHKGAIVPLVLGDDTRDTAVLALGDDRTDEDLFAALPPGSVAVHVGPHPSAARFRVSSHVEARALLRELLASAAPAATG